ncbi:MAG: hypothetical protein ACRDXX_08090 [Stackebrandtia sp.]
MTGFAAVETRPWRLSARGRKLTLLVHIVAAGAWVGIDVTKGIVVGAAMLSDDAETWALSYQVLELIATWPLFVAGLATLLSGVLLGMGTKYGLMRYWWVAVKLALNMVLVALVLFALRPEVVALASEASAGEAVPVMETGLIYPVVVAPSALLFAMTLAVFKPWGRIKKRLNGAR